MNTLLELWQLDGRGPYVWASLAVCVLAVALELAWLHQRRRALPRMEDAP